jgi:WD40 repeat protein
VAFSPHGRELASAGIDGIDGIVHLWNAQSATTILQLKVGVAMTALVWGPVALRWPRKRVFCSW